MRWRLFSSIMSSPITSWFVYQTLQDPDSNAEQMLLQSSNFTFEEIPAEKKRILASKDLTSVVSAMTMVTIPFVARMQGQMNDIAVYHDLDLPLEKIRCP